MRVLPVRSSCFQTAPPARRNSLASMKNAKSLATPDIRETIAATKDYPGVTGRISIDAQRNSVKSAVVLKVEAAGFKYQTTINP